MICPACKTQIDDACIFCPACRVDLRPRPEQKTSLLQKLQNTAEYCQYCGAFRDQETASCPCCGMQYPSAAEEGSFDSAAATHHTRSSAQLLSQQPDLSQSALQEGTSKKRAGESVASLSGEPAASRAKLDERSERKGAFSQKNPPNKEITSDAGAGDETHVIPRIASAIPAEPDPDYDDQISRLPSLRAGLLAALGALILVGGLALFLVHPWAPGAYDTRATKPADISHAGFPGKIESLAGQDPHVKPRNEDGQSKDFKTLVSIYEQLKVTSDALDRSLLNLQTQAKVLEDLHAQSKELIKKLQSFSFSDDARAQKKTHVFILASWLTNRAEDLMEAAHALSPDSKASPLTVPRAKELLEHSGDASFVPQDKSTASRSVAAPAHASGKNLEPESGYRQLFEGSYAAWNPQSTAKSVDGSAS